MMQFSELECLRPMRQALHLHAVYIIVHYIMRCCAKHTLYIPAVSYGMREKCNLCVIELNRTIITG